MERDRKEVQEMESHLDMGLYMVKKEGKSMRDS